jgi:PAS domain S-box-containing protein
MGKEKTKNLSLKPTASQTRKEIKQPVFLENENENNKAQYSIEIAKSMNECLWIGDSNHKTIYINPVYENLSEYSLKEAIGKPADFCFDKKSKQIIKEHHNRRKEGIGTQYEATMISKSGKKIPLLVSGAPTESGGTIGIFTNLSQQKSLKEKEEYLSSIIKNSSEAIVILNNSRKIQLWNKGAEQLFGHKESEVLNKSIDIIIPPEERQINLQLLEEVEEKQFLKGFEARRVDKNGKFLDIDLSVTKVMGGKKFLGYLIRYHDISEQKRHNNELQKDSKQSKTPTKNSGSKNVRLITSTKSPPRQFPKLASRNSKNSSSAPSAS